MFSTPIVPEAWMDRAACAEVGPGPWDSDVTPRVGQSLYRAILDAREVAEGAKAVCRRCPVAADCLEYAQRLDIRDGIYGGLGPDERRASRGRLLEPCGTDAARRRHKRHGDLPCATCDAIRARRGAA